MTLHSQRCQRCPCVHLPVTSSQAIVISVITLQRGPRWRHNMAATCPNMAQRWRCNITTDYMAQHRPNIAPTLPKIARPNMGQHRRHGHNIAACPKMPQHGAAGQVLHSETSRLYNDSSAVLTIMTITIPTINKKQISIS